MTLEQLISLLPSIFSVLVLPGIMLLWKISTKLEIIVSEFNIAKNEWREAHSSFNIKLNTVEKNIISLQADMLEIDKNNGIDHEKLRSLIAAK